MVGIRTLAEGHPDVNFLSRDNVKENVKFLGENDVVFELLIRTQNMDSAIEFRVAKIFQTIFQTLNKKQFLNYFFLIFLLGLF